MMPLLQIGNFATGGFQFSMDTAAYEEFVRRTEYRWASVPRFGKAPAQQFVGLGEDIIELKGTVYPHWRGGLYQIDDMRVLAAKGKPQKMVAMPLINTGVDIGYWVIKSVEEIQSSIRNGGIPGRQRFTMKLSAYGGKL